ncbi:MAG: ferredoxin [Planctomycetota bacterium]|nr:MAG: ferredoxin [Planctomycetota bacterium]
MASDKPNLDRRDVLKSGVRTLGALILGGLGGYALNSRADADEMLWQIDPEKCVACGNCATHCVLDQSAVRCVNSYEMCGYCDLCTGYFPPDPPALNTGAENQLCPTGAIIRKFVEDPYYEYKVEKSLCIACGKCVIGCAAFGNGSLYLQIQHDLCVHCNQCSIALACPSEAFVRVPRSQPYLLKTREASNADPQAG